MRFKMLALILGLLVSNLWKCDSASAPNLCGKSSLEPNLVSDTGRKRKCDRLENYNFLLNYNWYYLVSDYKCYLLADVLDANKFDSNIIEIRLIRNPENTDGIPQEYLLNESSSIIEIVENKDSNVIVSYYYIADDRVKALLSLAQYPEKNSPIYRRLITSFNFYYSSLTAKDDRILDNFNNNSPRRVRQNFYSPRIDEQAQLDYYLSTKNIESDRNSNNGDIASNISNPFFIANEKTSFEYSHQILSSQTSDNYTALIEHRLTFDIFSDLSISGIRPNPTLLKTIKSSWNYLYGENINPISKEIDISTQELSIASCHIF